MKQLATIAMYVYKLNNELASQTVDATNIQTFKIEIKNSNITVYAYVVASQPINLHNYPMQETHTDRATMLNNKYIKT